jgi:P27 family predicted phage terminase small subunit
MGFRGPKPEPAAVKIAKGNPGHRPIGADPQIPADQAGPVAPPLWLKKAGLAIWERLAPRLTAMKLLSAVDAEAFGRYCRNFARWEKMQRILDKEDEFYESESAHGKLKRVHPAFLVSDRLERQLLASEDRFGLNPAERQRLFAARAANPNLGDLFGGLPGGQQPAAPKPRGGDGKPAVHAASPIGLLN